MTSNSPMVAWWLLPAEPRMEWFQGAVRSLAEEFGSAMFLPHVTLFAGRLSPEENAENLLAAVAANAEPLTLRASGLAHSAEFTRTFVVEFEKTPEVSRLSEALRPLLSESSPFDFHPHLSLVYAGLSEPRREELVRGFRLPFQEVRFDRICTVEFQLPVRTRADVEAWTVRPPRVLGQGPV